MNLIECKASDLSGKGIQELTTSYITMEGDTLRPIRVHNTGEYLNIEFGGSPNFPAGALVVWDLTSGDIFDVVV